MHTIRTVDPQIACEPKAFLLRGIRTFPDPCGQRAPFLPADGSRALDIDITEELVKQDFHRVDIARGADDV